MLPELDDCRRSDMRAVKAVDIFNCPGCLYKAFNNIETGFRLKRQVDKIEKGSECFISRSANPFCKAG
jgi:hypothetical protein